MVMEKNGEVLIKNCFVQLEMLNLAEYDSDSSLDLPVPAYLRPSKKKSKKKKTSEELLLESQNLADNIAIDTVQNNDMEEKLRTLEIVEFPEPDDESLTPPLLKEEEFHVFSVKDSLQFFSKLDVTPSLCGYKNRVAFTAFEKKILSTKNVELEHVISSFLFSSNVYCISDCKSFVTYLLKNLSIYEDVGTVNACYNGLIMLLTKHPEAKSLTFSTAQIFMLLFNYGVDINSFQFLQQWSDVMNHLEVPTKCNASRIPNKWTLNLKKILKAVIKLLSTCTFKATDLCKIIVFFLWMCLDSTIVQENLYSVIKECISVCLNRITKDVWIKTLCDIARIVLSMEFSSEKEKWKNIAYMTEAIPVDSDKGIQLRKQISFLVLNSICKGDREPEIEDRFGFNLCELQHLLRKLKEIDTTLMSSATKFVDMCIRHLNTTTEEYQDLLKILKHSESHLDETAHEAKRHFATIHFKLSLLVGNKFKMYQDKNFNAMFPKFKDIQKEAKFKVIQEEVEGCSTGYYRKFSPKISPEANFLLRSPLEAKQSLSLPRKEKMCSSSKKPKSEMCRKSEMSSRKPKKLMGQKPAKPMGREPKKPMDHKPKKPSHSKFSKTRSGKNIACRLKSVVNKLHDTFKGTANESEDQYDIFGKHVASQLRELPVACYISLQSEIQGLITYERLFHV